MTLTMFLDIETTGLPIMAGYDKYHNPRHIEKYDTSRIIEIGYIIANMSGDIYIARSSLIKYDKPIPNTHIHNITNVMLINSISIATALLQLNDDITYNNIDRIVCHNVLFDMNILLSECCRASLDELAYKLNAIQLICTMREGKKHMAVDKFPKLTELYKHLYDEDIKQRHRAIDDARLCMLCYMKMQ